jgi:hypothetical protein
MNKNNYLKIILPVVAVLVIAESVVFVSGLSKKAPLVDSTVVPTDTTIPTGTATSARVTPAVPPMFNLTVSTKNQEMTIGKSYQVEVNSVSLGQKSLDAVNVYIKYDPTAFDVSNLVFDTKLPKPVFSKVSLQKSVVVVNYLISEKNGLVVKANENLALVKFTVKPKKTGNHSFEISSGNEAKESVTMLVENATSKALPYSSNKLTVNVLK